MVYPKTRIRNPFAPFFRHAGLASGPRPCRISLTDAKPGDELILVNHEHHAVASPYRMRFAIYVRKGEQTFDAVDEVRSNCAGARSRCAASMPAG